MIEIEVLTESCFKVPYFRIPKKRIYVTGEKYRFSARLTNRGNASFSGNFLMHIQWPNGLVVEWSFPLQNLAVNQMIEVTYGITDVLDSAPALFLLIGQDSNGQPVNFCDRAGNNLRSQKSGFTHVHTIIPKNAEELYQLWALLVALISIIPIFVKEIVIPLIQWLMSLKPP